MRELELAATELDSTYTTTAVNPVGDAASAADDVESPVLSLETVAARRTAVEGVKEEAVQATVAHVFAQLSEAPTNWQCVLRHQCHCAADSCR